MSDPFSLQARQRVFNRAAAQVAQQTASLLRDLEQDLFVPGKGRPEPRLLALFKLPRNIIDEVLTFDTRAAQHELKRVRVLGTHAATNPFDPSREQELLDEVQGQFAILLDGLKTPTRYRPKLNNLLKKIDGHLLALRLAEQTEAEHRIQDEYGRRRADFDLEVAARLKSPPRSSVDASAEALTGEDPGPCEDSKSTPDAPKEIEGTLKPNLRYWALGVEAAGIWHVFKLVKGQWRQYGRLNGISAGRQDDLLRGFAEGGGFLLEQVAFKREFKDYRAGDRSRLTALIKPELSRIRTCIRNAIKVANRKIDPLPWDEVTRGWRAMVQIGYAVQEDHNYLGGERRLRFRTREELTAEDRLDAETN
jgi:hypothetical protein